MVSLGGPAAASPEVCSDQQSASRFHKHFISLGSAPGPPEKFQVRGRGQEAGNKVRFEERWGRDMGAAAGVWQCWGEVERSKRPRRARLSLCFGVLN